MTTPEHNFQEKSDKLSQEVKIRQQQQAYIQSIQPLQKQAQLQFQDLELGRSRAKYLRQEALANLDNLLIQFEQTLTKRGVKVHWAADKEEAQHLIRQLLHQKNTSQVVQSQAAVLKEIELSNFLKSQDIQTIALHLQAQLTHYLTDEYNLDTWQGTPEASKLYQAIIKKDKIESLTSQPADLYAYLRKKALQQIKSEAVGIVGADFMIADTGSLSLSDDEGILSALLSSTQRHIAVVALSQMIAKLEDVELFWTLRDTYKYAKHQAQQHLLIHAPLPSDQAQQQKALDVIILDNGRSQLYEDEILRTALQCIHCEACATVCPVVPQSTTQSQQVYKGAIGEILQASQTKDAQFLLKHSTLCGACAEACPIDIPLAEMLRHLRGRQAKPSNGILASWNPFQPKNPFLQAVKQHYFKHTKLDRDFYTQWKAIVKNKEKLK